VLADAIRSVEELVLRSADFVLPVYDPLTAYLRGPGVNRYEVVYNALNSQFLWPKEDYRLHDPVRFVSVGRQLAGKDPVNLIRALAALPGVRLTMIGDGPLHPRLARSAGEADVSGRVEFRRAMANNDPCRCLRDFDTFAVHNDYFGIPKAVMEAFLVALPVVLNRRPGDPVPELRDDLACLVDDTPGAYAAALERLVKDRA
jgi:glycosyltransferase involved in cell wall biosynthesis